MRLRTVGRWAARIGAGVLVLVLAAVGTVYGLSERRFRTRVSVPTHTLVVPTDSTSVVRGEHLVNARGCVGCHGAHLQGHVELDDPMIGRLAGPNLTRGGRGAALTDFDWERAVRHGVTRDCAPLLFMPAVEHTGLSDEDLGAIVAYARSLQADAATPPVSRAGPVLRAMFAARQVNLLSAEEIDHARLHPARVTPAPTAAYGGYLATMCAGCHGRGFSGGKVPGTPPDWPAAANLTREGIGAWSEADLARALRTGRRPDRSLIDTAHMPVNITRHLDDTELAALYAFFQSVPSRPFGGR